MGMCACTGVCVCMGVCVVCASGCVCAWVYGCVCVCMGMYVCIWGCVCMGAYVCTHKCKMTGSSVIASTSGWQDQRWQVGTFANLPVSTELRCLGKNPEPRAAGWGRGKPWPGCLGLAPLPRGGTAGDLGRVASPIPFPPGQDLCFLPHSGGWTCSS